jgi:hypothetical protein
MPNKTKTDGPFKTFEKVRNTIRSLRKSDTPIADTIFINIKGGLYFIDKTLKLESIDSGENGFPVIWQSNPGEIVHLVGGKVIGNFKLVSDKNILKRIKKEFQNKIFVTDLKSQGITDYGVFPNRLELFFKGERMEVARYPNKGWIKIADVPQYGEKLYNEGDKKVIYDNLPSGRHYGRFLYDGERPNSWAEDTNIWMHGFWCWDWRDTYHKIEKIDKMNHTIYPAQPHHWYGYRKGQRYYFVNILEEIDEPGEWYLDDASGLLYFWPPSKIGKTDVIVSLLKESMFYLDNTSNVTIQNLTLEDSRMCLIKMKDGKNNMIAGCTIRNVGFDSSITINGGNDNGIRSCDLYNLGGTGVKISGGDKKTLTPAGNYAINNHIHSYGKNIFAFNGAIWLDGVGNLLSHNKIHNGPASGIQYYGNDHLIQFNEIYDLAHECGDIGGVNTGAEYTDQGTIIKYNYFHHAFGPGQGGFRAVYLDLPGSGTTIFGNLFYKVDIGVFFNSGRDNLVKNNVFVKCSTAVNIYYWPHRQYFEPGGAWKIVEKMFSMNYKDPPYSIKYPKLPTYLDLPQKGNPVGNIVENNISYGNTGVDLSEEMNINTDIVIKNNIFADSLIYVITNKWTPNYDPYKIGFAAVYPAGDKEMTRKFQMMGNVVSDKDPGFIDVKNENFQLRDDSLAYKLGFQKIPIDKIGLFIDDFRKKLPLK